MTGTSVLSYCTISGNSNSDVSCVYIRDATGCYINYSAIYQPISMQASDGTSSVLNLQTGNTILRITRAYSTNTIINIAAGASITFTASTGYIEAATINVPAAGCKVNGNTINQGTYTRINADGTYTLKS